MSCALSLMLPVFFAFNPPVDTAGPVTLTIEMGKVTRTGAFEAVVENRGQTELKGTISFTATPPWKIEPKPGAEAPRLVAGRFLELSVPAADTRRVPLLLRSTGTIFPEYYAVHAKGTFRAKGGIVSAHPIALFQPQVERPEPAQTPKRVLTGTVPPSGGSILDAGIGRVSFYTFSKEKTSGAKAHAVKTKPQGWEGGDDRTGTHFNSKLFVQRGSSTRPCLAFHPPWRGGPGRIQVDFPLLLPETPLALDFAVAIRDNTETEPPSDGVTFLLHILTEKETEAKQLFSRHTESKKWLQCSVDLSVFAGKKIVLRLSGDPGPRNDTTCDQAYVADLMLRPASKGEGIQGYEAQAAPDFGLAASGNRSLEVQRGSLGIWNSAFSFLQEAPTDSAAEPEPLLRFDGFQGTFLLPDGRGINPCWFSRSTAWDLTDDSIIVKQHLTTGGVIQCRITTTGGCFSLDFSAEGGELLDIAPGPFTRKARRVYAGPGNVIEEPAHFALSGDGHRLSTRFVGFDFPGASLVMATGMLAERLEVVPERRLYRLVTGEDPVFHFSLHPDSIFKALTQYRRDVAVNQKAASGIQALKGRFVFDLWGGHYRPSAESLRTAFQYGLTHSMVVWHNWQRWGYDYRLPAIFPPNPQLGSREDFRHLADVCRQKGVLFAPHDNYIDIYPDYPGFSYDHVCMTKSGQPVRAWYNRGRKAQSYRFRPDRFFPFLKKNVALLKEEISPTAYFIDVFSSIGPVPFYDREGRRHRRRETRRRWGEAFAWIREFLGEAPQVSESGHDGLIGYLDGAQTNHMRVDADAARWTWKIPCKNAERIPWFDFVWHDKFVLHGAGYPNRFAGSLPMNMHSWFSDDYLSTEVMTGHPPMVSRPFDRNVIRKYYLWYDFADSIGLERLEDVAFVNGDIHVQKITYENGATLLVNRSEGAVKTGGTDVLLPRYGFLASYDAAGKTVGKANKKREAAVALRNGILCEWARGPDFYYANARTHDPLGRLPLQPELKELHADPDNPRRLKLTFTWKVHTNDRAAFKKLIAAHGRHAHIFVHFVPEDDDTILCQADHAFPQKIDPDQPIVSSARTTIPADAAGKTLRIVIGLYYAGSHDNRRLPLFGPDAGSGRILAATCKVSSNGTFTFEKPHYSIEAERLNPAGTFIDFNFCGTDGAFRLARGDAHWILTALPGQRTFRVFLPYRHFPRFRSLKDIDAFDIKGKKLKDAVHRLHTPTGVKLEIAPEVFQCRLR